MAFEEQKEQYKALPLAKRLFLMAIVGAILPGYVYYDESELLTSEIAQVESQKVTAETKLAEAQQKKAQLPTKLKELESAKTDLATLSSTFATSYDVDEILRKTAGSARDNGVELESFKPEPAVESGGLVKYSRQDIAIVLHGKFVETTRFLDSLLNLGPLIYLSGINYSQFLKTPTLEGQLVADKVEDAKERTMVRVNAKLMVFRKVLVD